ncbi:hypothetical protein [Streptomyces poonensis]|uniref:hypothetical protein n=1 Tax=Streptomyces poonensis TaxID=68255 RepID=UPI00167856E3|nr:hypothetical protein [Streptomyces poonensis]GLJ88866.1 hypothetical protein GCM10017589_14660 [Streptomyces poonensis]
MPHLIALLLTWLLRLLLPPRGRHRAVPRTSSALLAGQEIGEGVRDASACPPVPPSPWLPGEASPLVRPYLLTPAELAHRKHVRRQQRHRRRALWLATYGVDVGPRRIHGVEVPA